MIHKRLQTNIVREDGLSGLAYTTIAAGRVGRRWVEFGEKEASLRSTRVADNEAWKGEAVLDEFLL